MFAIVIWVVVGCAGLWLVCLGAALVGAVRAEIEQQTVRQVSNGMILPPSPKEEKHAARVKAENERLRKVLAR